jgi:hypothetical protein
VRGKHGTSVSVTDFWFATLRCPVLRVTKAVANAASRRISEKQKMRLVGTEERDYVSGRLQAEMAHASQGAKALT